jgi:pilus assembly protein CpaB
MNRRLLTILMTAFLIASGCTYLVWRMVGQRVAPVRASTTRVVAAAEDIKLGTVLSAANLATIDVAGPLPKGSIQRKEQALGRGVISSLYQGEPILESRLAPAGSGGGLAATIRDGMRACAVRVDEVVGVAGFVTPGLHVDVLFSGIPPGAADANRGPVVKTVLQNIEVLSAGTDIEKTAEGKPRQVQVVNLLVTPEQAETLSLAGNQIRIQLVLRNPLDTKIVPVSGTALASIFANPGAAVRVSARPGPKAGSSAPPSPPAYSIEVINGSQRLEHKFDSPEVKP